MSSLNSAASGMQAMQVKIDVIANNLANIETTGYQEYQVAFTDLFYQEKIRTGGISSEAGNTIPTGLQIGVGVTTASTYRITKQGELVETGNKTDIAIQGRGYLRVLMPDGSVAYTRDGAMQLNQDGDLVTTNKGYVISPGINIPAETVDVQINGAGEVWGLAAGQEAAQLLGQLDLAYFINEKGLKPIGDNLLSVTDASGDEIVTTPGSDGVGTVLQGWLEHSNTNPVTQITELIKAERAYEFCSTCMEASSDILKQITQLRV